jgi:hypothetical protein
MRLGLQTVLPAAKLMMTADYRRVNMATISFNIFLFVGDHIAFKYPVPFIVYF